jgi:hypothetical protein
MPNLFLHFFATIDELHLVTLQLELYHDKLSCPHCQAFGQFVSHGFVYKYLSASEVSVVGKRLFCSNRSNHSGCGKTIRLYVSKRVPKISYHAANVTLFVMSLIAGMSIKNAYHKATGASEPRHAYRWLNKLNLQCIRFRGIVYQQAASSPPSFQRRSRRLLLLLPTLHLLFFMPNFSDCCSVQIATQVVFF